MSPEILMILEADVVCVTEGSIHTTVSLSLRSWNIAGSSGTRQGDVSPAGSQTVAWYQMVTMGTREAQYAPLDPHIGEGVCFIKHIDGKIPQIAYWESDQFIVDDNKTGVKNSKSSYGDSLKSKKRSKMQVYVISTLAHRGFPKRVFQGVKER